LLGGIGLLNLGRPFMKADKKDKNNGERVQFDERKE